jgi:hypothetical protein
VARSTDDDEPVVGGHPCECLQQAEHVLLGHDPTDEEEVPTSVETKTVEKGAIFDHEGAGHPVRDVLGRTSPTVLVVGP